MGVKIIDLPDLTGLPENGDYVAVTDGTVTAKLNYQLLAQAIIEEDPECQSDKYGILWKRLRELRKTNINWGVIS